MILQLQTLIFNILRSYMYKSNNAISTHSHKKDTEIDWIAYMEEVGGFLGGQLDYKELKGQTGPLVYPAGFVYIFAAFKYLTAGGNIFMAQILFAGIYLVTQALVFEIYIQSRVVPPYALVLLCLSKRLHSIYVLRLFNDCVAMLPLYASVFCMQKGQWKIALALFSIAVSIKMNILLMAPSVFMLLLMGAQRITTFVSLLIAASIQLILGAPFLVTFPWSYLSRSFDLGRQFMYKWTVNFRFLPEDIFLSRQLSIGLLLIHAVLLVIFAHYKWCKAVGGFSSAFRIGLSGKSGTGALQSSLTLYVIFSGNVIGILCARSLHYQFYCWYFHTLPFLLWCTGLPIVLKLAIWLIIEICWNVYPSTVLSSVSLLLCHIIVVLSLFFSPSSIEFEMGRQKRVRTQHDSTTTTKISSYNLRSKGKVA